MLAAAPAAPPPLRAAVDEAAAALVKRHGEAHRPSIERGLRQAAALWRPADGDARAFRALAEEQFRASPEEREALLARFERVLEQLDGTAAEANRALRWATDVDRGPVLPVDPLFAALDAGAHQDEDLFAGKLAFVALLNFPQATPEERQAQGAGWSRRRWAEDRLTSRFALRVPASATQAMARAAADAEIYIAGYNLWVHHLVTGDPRQPERLFPAGLRLLSHWNLRDQIRSDYAGEGGLPRQRLLQKAMERIVDQTIPAAVVNDPAVDWNPFTNQVWPAPAAAIEGGAPPRARVDGAREPDRRYAVLLDLFRAGRLADPWSPATPTLVQRRFDLDRGLPEARVVALLREVLDAPVRPRLARLIEKRMGRKLEPFDIWYDGFRPRSRHAEAELDALTRQRYPDADAFRRDLPRILGALGFAPEKARFLAEHIAVDPARGSGHAQPAGRRSDLSRLRTRVGAGGMDYKGYNIAVHELGHNVEQVFSLHGVDSTLLAGVPNNAFTEALAFVFQARDLELLGLGRPDAEAQGLQALDAFWSTAEMAGVALVDIGVWRWMYQHPRATPAELRQATLRAAREVWNAHFAPLFGVRDSPLLAVYSHMIGYPLYLPDYPVGYLIASQVEERLRAEPALGPEFERMARIGKVAPDVWMRSAAGEAVSAGALLRAAAAALDVEERR
ncbi:MAG: hypothetical protein HZB56_21125 [Deltaproteobacteria bacterium]|nr:hypothetical protein [Deltaproteobacteria bacterium]